MIAQASFHRRSNPQRLMHTREVVVHVEQRDRVNQVVNLLTERIGQSGEAPHLHSHVEILALYVAGRNVCLIRVADDFYALGAQTLRGAVALLPFRIVAINLHQLCVVDLISKRVGNGSQIHPMAVRGQLDSIRQSASYILKEVRCTARVPPAYSPTDNKLCVCVNRGEGPNVSAVAYAVPHLLRGVLLLGITKIPNLINLYSLRRYVVNGDVQVVRARVADFRQQAEDSTLRYARHTRRGTDGTTFHKRRDDRRFLRHAEYVCHDLIMPDRLSIVKRKAQLGTLFLGLFGPALLGCEGRYFTPAFRRHGNQTHLSAFRSALFTHLRHDQRDHALADSLRRSYDGIKGTARGLHLVLFGFLRNAFTAWHTSSVAWIGQTRQEGRISN